ncbi:hypothetical protein BP5796_07654 [Coleophoma crateriformis]|uniref:DUF6536 domain-containing protein n=1 Tax=Coleophoma crateriformis TaxID=565419 RepID=A0A3D8RJK0_9HELO|nr:hypothetical protein BP5796_07654 [Coleophoma crateriformis]
MELTRLSPPELESDVSFMSADNPDLIVKNRMTSASEIVEEDQTLPSKIDVRRSIFSSPRVQKFGKFGWFRGPQSRTGVQVGLGISVFVFTINLLLLLVGAIRKPGYKAGIGTLHRGTSDSMSKLSTAYHILINIMSTGLLTSSSYCMQLLCAPRREDIDAAHAQGNYIDIGILSFRNLKYNSAVFEVTAGQNYAINFVDCRNTTLVQILSSSMIKLENSRWKSLYSTKYVPNSSNLYLVIDSISFEISIDMSNNTWDLVSPDTNTDYSWQALPLPINPQNTSISMSLGLALNESSRTFVVARQKSLQRAVVPLAQYLTTSMPVFDIPEPLLINVTNHIWRDRLALNPESWMFPPFHIDYAFSETLQTSNSIQISLAFMLVVVICNALKIFVIYQTLQERLSSQILTFGDAVSSFLEHPDPTTAGLCTLERSDIIMHLKNPNCGDIKPWKYHTRLLENSTRERWVSNIYIWSAAVIAFFVMVFVILLARPTELETYADIPPAWDWNWATSSAKQLPIAQSSFDTGGILFNAWLANAPQLLLSVAYFALNRMCTSICFIREWNDCATHRKGLRVTERSGEQRPAYFLQLPYRWAIPLTITSGLLHWLLSQSLFLVLLEIRDTDGTIISSESRSTVGYSNLSLLVFATIYFAMLLPVLVLQLRKITFRIPSANHCSLVISAACHPPPDDRNAQLRNVQWGAVRARYGGKIGHCSFTSEEVLPPEEGKFYA